MPACSTPAITPSIGSSVEATFATSSSPLAWSSTQTSVNVPPTSTATTRFVADPIHGPFLRVALPPGVFHGAPAAMVGGVSQSAPRSIDTAAREVLDLARSVLGELDVDAVLDRVLTAGRELTGARYAAVGVLDDTRTRLARLVTEGLDADTLR